MDKELLDGISRIVRHMLDTADNDGVLFDLLVTWTDEERIAYERWLLDDLARRLPPV